MHKISLRFKDDEIEQLFIVRDEKLHKQFYKVVIVLIQFSVLSISLSFYLIDKEQQIEDIVIGTFLLIISLSVGIYGLFNYKKINHILYFIFSCFFTFINYQQFQHGSKLFDNDNDIEEYKQYDYNQQAIRNFNFGFNLSFPLLIMMFLKSPWYVQSSWLFFQFLIYCLFKLSNFYIYSYQFLISWLLYSYITFKFQQIERKRFQEDFTHKQYIESLVNIINKDIQAPIAIAIPQFVESNEKNGSLGQHNVSYLDMKLKFQNETFQQLFESQEIFFEQKTKCLSSNNQYRFMSTHYSELKTELIRYYRHKMQENQEISQQDITQGDHNTENILKSQVFKDSPSGVLNIEFDNIEYNVQLKSCLWGENQSGILITIINITAQQKETKIKSLQEVNQFKDHILRTVTHDLRTPLNTIKCWTQIAKDNDSIENIKTQNLPKILKNCEMLELLINDILDYSQIQKNKSLKIINQEFTIKELFAEVYDLFEYQSSARNIQLNFKNIISQDKYDFRNSQVQQYNELEEDIQGEHIKLNTDKLRVKQILMNLVGNALKFTQKGSVSIIGQKITIEQQNHIFQCYKIEVLDTGVGIPKERFNKLFKIFQTFNDQGSQNQNGIGLGLTISKDLVGLLGPKNQIDLQSIQNEGSSFSFVLFQNYTDKQSFTALTNNLFTSKIQQSRKYTNQLQQTPFSQNYKVNNSEMINDSQAVRDPPIFQQENSFFDSKKIEFAGSNVNNNQFSPKSTVSITKNNNNIFLKHNQSSIKLHSESQNGIYKNKTISKQNTNQDCESDFNQEIMERFQHKNKIIKQLKTQFVIKKPIQKKISKQQQQNMQSLQMDQFDESKFEDLSKQYNSYNSMINQLSQRQKQQLEGTTNNTHISGKSESKSQKKCSDTQDLDGSQITSGKNQQSPQQLKNFQIKNEIKDKSEINVSEQKVIKQKLTKINVLIVDDDFFNTDSLKNILLLSLKNIFELEIIIVYDGQTAVEKVYEMFKTNNYKFSVIFMDINMPILDGLSAAKKIRELEKKQKLLYHPFIWANSANGEMFEEEIKLKIVDDVVPKPISSNLIKQKFKQLEEKKLI